MVSSKTENGKVFLGAAFDYFTRSGVLGNGISWSGTGLRARDRRVLTFTNGGCRSTTPPTFPLQHPEPIYLR